MIKDIVESKVDYFYIRQKVGRKRIYAVWEGDHLSYCNYVCGFPTEQAARAFCAEKNEEERQKRMACR